MEIFERIQEIIAKELAIDKSKVVESAFLVDDLDSDSLNKFSIISAMEEEFGVELEGDEIMEIETVGDLVKLISK